MRRVLCVKVKQRQILPGLPQAYHEQTGSGAHEKTTRPCYAIRAKIALESLRQGIFKFNVCRFIAAPKGGHKRFPVCLIRVLDIIKGFAQRAFNRLNLCNRHISASTPFISSMSSW